MIDDDFFEERERPKKEGQVFTRYNREERLKNAPLRVKQMHDRTFVERKGILRTLTATKGLRFVFFVIILLVVLNLIFFALFKDRPRGKIYDARVELSTFVFDGVPLASFKMDANPDSEIKNELVKVQFSFFDKDENKISSQIQSSVYTGAELSFSTRDESKKAKTVEVYILTKEKLLKLTKRIDD